VDLAVFDLQGRRVATLLAGELPQGSHTAAWAGRDEAGREVAAGVYHYVLWTESGRELRRKMVFLR
jgi:flagellar hook assembly protein FlgD